MNPQTQSEYRQYFHIREVKLKRESLRLYARDCAKKTPNGAKTPYQKHMLVRALDSIPYHRARKDWLQK